MLISSIIFLLISNAVSLRREVSTIFSRYSIIVLINTMFLTYLSINASYTLKLSLYNGLFFTSLYSQIFIFLILMVGGIILILSGFHPYRLWGPDHAYQSNTLHYKFFCKKFNHLIVQFAVAEYPLLLLFVIVGATLLLSTNDLISVFLCIELQSYGLYLMCGINRNSELSTSASLMYFLLGGLASCFILLGQGLLYTCIGGTSLEGLHIIFDISNTVNTFKGFYFSLLMGVSLSIMSIGFLFKISAAPFHFWSPDVYDSVPTVVTTFLSIMAKISILVFLLNLSPFTIKFLSEYTLMFNYNWTNNLIISSVLSLIIGTVLGLTQFRIKRLYAYSTISHIGFILLALGIYSVESVQAFVFYLIQYTIINLNAFFLLISIGLLLYLYHGQYKNNKEIAIESHNSPLQFISQLKGYFYENSMLSLSLAITLFSFIGVPPLTGFFAKQMVLSAALDNGYIFICLIAILVSVISAVYYLVLIKQMFFHKQDRKNINRNLAFKESRPLMITNISIDNRYLMINNYISIIISIITLLNLGFMLWYPMQWNLNIAMCSFLLVKIINKKEQKNLN